MMQPMPSAVRFGLQCVQRFLRKETHTPRSGDGGCRLGRRLDRRARSRLGPDERRRTRLALERETVFGGGDADVLLEQSGEMTLIAESGRNGDIAEGIGRRREPAAREL